MMNKWHLYSLPDNYSCLVMHKFHEQNKRLDWRCRFESNSKIDRHHHCIPFGMYNCQNRCIPHLKNKPLDWYLRYRHRSFHYKSFHYNLGYMYTYQSRHKIHEMNKLKGYCKEYQNMCIPNNLLLHIHFDIDSYLVLYMIQMLNRHFHQKREFHSKSNLDIDFHYVLGYRHKSLYHYKSHCSYTQLKRYLRYHSKC